ncbi:MAG: hypothetical protein LBD82_02305 [Deltaproteobacteria bacterium]|jgi:uncharacterized protein HemX|nr:hypothetical protein [Deltaproteobacteria bacterium]
MIMVSFLFLAFTLLEIFVLFLLWRFFRRLRQSEDLLTDLQNGQADLLEKLQFNANLESELMSSFKQRQRELQQLDERLREHAAQLRSLLEQADQVSRSPQFLRELILNGHRQGLALTELARRTGLSVDEVELILNQ